MTFCPYGQIFVVSGSTAQTITTGLTFEKLTAFTDDGPFNTVTPVAASDKITLIKSGVYLVNFNSSFSGTVSSTVTFYAKWNGVIQTQLIVTRKLGTGGDVGSCGFSGLLYASIASADLEIWFTTDGDGDSITVVDAQLSAVWVGTT